MEHEEQKITDLLDEEVIHIEVEKNTEVNMDDFATSEEEEPEEEEEEGDPDNSDPDSEEEEQEEEDEEPKKPEVDSAKQKAIVNQAKKRSGMAFTMYNFAAKRAGKILSPKKPDHFKIIGEDREDLQDMLNATVEEENWSGVKSKWFFIAGFLLLIVERVMTIKRPIEVEAPENTNKALTSNTNNPDIAKQLQTMQTLIEQLQEQNKLYKEMLNTRTQKKNDTEEDLREKYSRMRFYKGYDMSKISFTKNGAIKDPSKAGQHGYTNEGVKMGAIGKDIQDVKRQYDLYREFALEHSINIEEAEILD